MSDWPPTFDLNLGNNHGITWVIAGEHDDSRIGCVIYHKMGPKGNITDFNGWCCGGVHWAPSEFEREHPERMSESERQRARWNIEGQPDEHLTISPSVLCSCGDHGFIKDGKWIVA